MTAVDTSFDKVLEQHAELRSTIEELRGFLGRPRPSVEAEDCGNWAQCLAERLTKLHGTVLQHFREEERSGFLEGLEERHPRAAHSIELLKHDHSRILADFRAVLAAVMVYAEGEEPENPHLGAASQDAPVPLW